MGAIESADDLAAVGEGFVAQVGVLLFFRLGGNTADVLFLEREWL